MDLRHLKTFRMVATKLSFSRAAAALDYAQSTVTAHIQALETELGVPLFDRLGRRIRVTDAGRILVDYADRVLLLCEEMCQSVAGQQVMEGVITVGAPETVCTYRLPKVLQRFRQEAPNVRLVFRPMPYGRIFRSVQDGGVDVAFLLEADVRASSLNIEALTPEPLVLVAAPQHPLVGQDPVCLGQLQGESLLLTERGCGYRGMFERALLAEGIVPSTQLEFDSVEAIKQCVMADVGIALLPRVAVERELRRAELAMIHCRRPAFCVSTQMIWHKDKWLSPALRAFLSISRQELARMTPAIADGPAPAVS